MPQTMIGSEQAEIPDEVLTAVRPRLIKTETALHNDDVQPRLPQAVHRPNVAPAADLSTPISAGQPTRWRPR
jgi:hypothetical protein